MRGVWLALLLLVFITGCATSADKRSKLTPPGALQGLSAVYSELDMRLQLVTASNAPACVETECAADRAFEQRILAIGKRLADVAFRQHPELRLRFPRFEFIIVDKAEAGAVSSAAGSVVIYRGVRQLQLDDAALGFVLAREIGHIVSEHHDENMTTNVLVALAAQILFPVLNVARGAAAAVSSSAASGITGTAVASAASFAGARALRANYRPLQVREAESVAFALLMADGWDSLEISDQLSAVRPELPDDSSWLKELRGSATYLASLLQGPRFYEEVVPQTAFDQTEPNDVPRALRVPF